MRACWAVAAAVALAVGAMAEGAIKYSVTDLGTLPGTSSTELHAINNSGQIVGWTEATGGIRALFYDGTSMQQLGTLYGGETYAWGISDSGIIVGQSQRSGGSQYYAAFRYDGTMHDLNWQIGSHPPGGGALAINGAGQIAGYSYDAVGRAVACVYDSNNGPASLGTFTGSTLWMYAYGVNSSGQVVGRADGSFGTKGFLWTAASGLQDLSGLGGTLAPASANAINDRGQVVGDAAYMGSGYVSHAFLYDATNGVKDLGTLGTDASSYAKGINNVGQVVGWSKDDYGNTRPFLYDDATMVDLNDLIDPQASWHLEKAWAINDR